MNRAVGQTRHLPCTFTLCTFCQEVWGSKPEGNYQITALMMVSFLGIKQWKTFTCTFFEIES